MIWLCGSARWFWGVLGSFWGSYGQTEGRTDRDGHGAILCDSKSRREYAKRVILIDPLASLNIRSGSNNISPNLLNG